MRQRNTMSLSPVFLRLARKITRASSPMMWRPSACALLNQMLKGPQSRFSPRLRSVNQELDLLYFYKGVSRRGQAAKMTDEPSATTEEKSAPSVYIPSNAPVFVLGSPRSGTTLLYHMLLSSGGFAVYRSETHVFNMLETAYGDLGNASNKRKLMKAWLGSKLFRVSGLDAD